eukprot:4857751-Alexandrium_andersonii.AAC.1
MAAEASRADRLYGAPQRARLHGWRARLSAALARTPARGARELLREPRPGAAAGGAAGIVRGQGLG